MKDDLLIRFIDGKTTPEETELVLNELSQDGEAAKEWLQMVQGARLVDTKPIVSIDSNDFVERALDEKSAAQNRGKKVIRLPWIISGVTVVAASVAIIATIITNNNVTPETPEDIMAEVSDTTTVMPKVNSTVAEEAVDIKEVSHQAVADVITPTAEERKNSMDAVENNERGKDMQNQSDELLGNKILQDSNTTTASQIEASSFEMVRPAKSPYRIRVQNPEKEFVFEWKVGNASEVHFTIVDKDGKIIIEKEHIVESKYGIAAIELVDKGELEWIVEVSINDSTSQRKTGKIELVSVK